MLWHRQELYKSKGDKLCSSAECRIWTRGLRHQIASRLNAHWQTDWAIEDQAKNLELDSPSNLGSTKYDQRAFSPLDPTVSWLSHLALAIYIFVVVNFDALAQASDIQIERRLVVFSPLDPTVSWLSHLALAIYIFVVVNFDARKRYSNRKETSWLLNEGFEPGVSDTKLPADWMLADKPTELLRNMLKILNSTARPYDQRAFSPLDPTVSWLSPVPMISEHSAHLTPLSVDFRTWLWRYTYLLLLTGKHYSNRKETSCVHLLNEGFEPGVSDTKLLLLISMLWHRQAIFKSKGDKLCSSVECRIWTRGLRHQIGSRLNARWQTDWAIEDQAKNLELDSPSLWSASIQPTWPHCQLTFAPGCGDIHICCC